jgi:hypothetical protein
VFLNSSFFEQLTRCTPNFDAPHLEAVARRALAIGMFVAFHAATEEVW